MKKKAAAGEFVKRSGKTKKTKPDERSGHVFLAPAFTNNSNVCYLIGGYCDRGPLHDVWSYHLPASDWKLLANDDEMSTKKQQSPLPRYEFDGCLTTAGIHVFGGFQTDGHEVSITNDLWLFDLEMECWQLVSEESKPPERSGHVMVTVGEDKFVLHGGTCMGTSRGDLWMYDTKLKDWQEIQCDPFLSPPPRWMHAAVYCPDSHLLVVFGGLIQPLKDPQHCDPVYMNDLWVLDLSTLDLTGLSKWQEVQYRGLAPSPRDLPAMVAVQGGVIVMGGFGLWELDEDEDEEEEEEEENEEDEDGDAEEEGEGESHDGKEMDVVEHQSEGEADNTHGDSTAATATPRATAATVAASVDDIQMTMEECTVSAAAVEVGDGGPEVDSEEIEDGDVDDEQSVVAAYLDDSWFVNLSTAVATELDLDEALYVTGGAISAGTAPPPMRGSKLAVTTHGILCFGGFDGGKFHAEHASLDATKVRLQIAAQLEGKQEIVV